MPGFVTLFGVALLTIAALTVGRQCGRRALQVRAPPRPATCGVAIDVPLIVFVAVSFVFQVDVMLEPGAKMSTQVP